jgi:hypothetical protein
MPANTSWRLPLYLVGMVAGALCAVQGSAEAAAKAARVEIPIARVVMPDGIVRFTVDLKIGGGAPFSALLDTGSTGVVVMAKALGDRPLPRIGKFWAVYGSGERLEGPISSAKVNIGGIDSGAAMRIGVVQSVSCIPEKPKCSAANLKLADYGIAGDGISGAGFKAIVGIGFDRFLMANPLVLFGATSWIVKLPSAETPGDGALILNPDAHDMDGFKTYPISRDAYRMVGAFRAAVPGCLTAPETGLDLCGQVALDTGTPGVIAQVASLPPMASAKEPQRYSLNLSQGAGKLEIPIEATWSTRRLVYFELNAQGKSPAINAGAAPYLSYYVFYDFRNNQVGVKPR